MLLQKKLVTVPVSGPRLEEHNPELAFIVELSNHLSTMRSVNQVLKAAMEMLREFFGVEAGRVYLMDWENECLNLVFSVGIDVRGLEKIAVGQGFTGSAASSRSFLAQRVSELADKSRAAKLTRRGLKSVLCLPLLARDEVVGVINLGAKRVLELDNMSINLCIVAGSMIANAVRSALYADELRARAEDMRQRHETIKFFSYTASHDLKGPAAAIHGLALRLQKLSISTANQKMSDTCHYIMQAAARIETLADELNAYIAAKEAPLALEMVDVGQVLDMVVRDYKAVMDERGITWSRPRILPVVVADRMALVRIFQNLVDNAVKYGGAGLTSISAGWEEQEGFHVFNISDNGVGMTPEQAAKAFGLFSRTETSKGIHGSGLGMAIVQEMARRHGGDAWIVTSSGEGCTVHFSLSTYLEL